jgi:outer membrane immunogenic protein
MSKKHLCIVAAVLTASLAPAIAADSGYYNYNTGSAPAAVSNWQGGYIGAHIGVGFGKAGASRTSGALGGLQAGYNWQNDRFVMGAEADVTAADVSSRSIADTYRQDWRGSARGRVGYAFSNVLAFGTAGFTMTGTEYKSALGTKSTSVTGWVAGAGADMQFTPSVILRAELLHYDFSDQTYPGSNGPVRIGATSNVLRAGLNYKF